MVKNIHLLTVLCLILLNSCSKESSMPVSAKKWKSESSYSIGKDDFVRSSGKSSRAPQFGYYKRKSKLGFGNKMYLALVNVLGDDFARYSVGVYDISNQHRTTINIATRAMLECEKVSLKEKLFTMALKSRKRA